MPIGELSDFIDFYAASEGLVELKEKKDEKFFPMGVK